MSDLLLPTAGRCLHCSNPQPCYAHTPIALKTTSGRDIVYANMPTMLAAIIARLSEIEKQFGIVPPVPKAPGILEI